MTTHRTSLSFLCLLTAAACLTGCPGDPTQAPEEEPRSTPQPAATPSPSPVQVATPAASPLPAGLPSAQDGPAAPAKTSSVAAREAELEHYRAFAKFPEMPLLVRYRDRGESVSGVFTHGRLSSLQRPGRTEAFTYHGDGTLATRTSAGWRQEYVQRWANGRVEITTYTPTGERRLAAVVFDDKTGHPVLYALRDGARWEFDWEGGRLVEERGPRGTLRYGYQEGQLRSFADASGVELRIARSGGTTRVTNAEGGVIELTHAEAGRLVRAESEGGRLELRYEGDRLSQVAGEDASFAYSSSGDEETRRSRFGTRRVARKGGKVVSVTGPAGTFSFEHDALSGDRTQLVYPNGVVARYTRNEERELQRLESSALNLRQVWNERHELTQRERDGERATYRYGIGGLVGVERGAEQVRYEVDADGFRARETSAAGTFALQRDAVGRWKARVRLDAQGKPTETVERYESDEAGRLLAIHYGAGRTDRFGYDGFGRLVSVQRAGKPALRYGYDALGRIVERRVGAARTRYVYDGLQLVAELGPKGRVRVYANGVDVDEPLAYRDGKGPWTYLHADERGTVLAYTDAAGERIERVDYTPFGELRAAPRDASRPLFFAGHRYDAEAGLVLARARVYEPRLNRFLGPDPAGIRDGRNPFLYAQGNPLSFVDPLGLWAQPGTTRAHYGALGAQAQLALLAQVQGMRVTPVASLAMSFFSPVLGKLGGTSEDAPAALARLIEEAESREDALALLEGDLGKAAKAQMSRPDWKVFKGVAELEYDADRKQDGAVLREVYAPTPEEAKHGNRMIRRKHYSDMLHHKYVGGLLNEAISDVTRAVAGTTGAIERREVLTKRACDVMTDEGAASVWNEFEEGHELKTLAPKRAPLAPKVHEAPSVKAFAKSRADYYETREAVAERIAYEHAVTARRNLWAEHAETLASSGSVREAIRAGEAADLTELVAKFAQADLDAKALERSTEQAYRQAMREPLNYVAVYRAIEKEPKLFSGDGPVRLLKETRAAAYQQAAKGKLYLANANPKAHARPNYAKRLRELGETLREEDAVVAARERDKAEREARMAKARAKHAERRKSRGHSGISLSGGSQARVPGGRKRSGVSVSRGAKRSGVSVSRSRGQGRGKGGIVSRLRRGQ